MRKKRRDLALIADELKTALQREAADIIAIGDLLIEAKEALPNHGDWLPWLAANFGSSITTASRYMNAARFAAKFCTVQNLQLRPTALYLLGSLLEKPDELFSPKAVEAILKAAETEWVNDKRAKAIAKALQPPSETVEEQQEREAKQEAERRAAEEALKKEADAFLDGPPPEVPPTAEPQPKDVILPQFDRAVEALAQIYTKPLTSFAGTTQSPDRIAAIATFLKQVADRMKEHAGAALETAEADR